MADSMQPPKVQKRPAAFGEEDDLPHPRRCSFKRKLQPDLEERFRGFIIAALEASIIFLKRFACRRSRRACRWVWPWCWDAS